jgi:alcohol dehydrogenase
VPGLDLATRIVFAPGAVDQLGRLARELGAARVFLVTDPGLCAAGHVAHAEAALVAAGLVVRRFDAVHENPNDTDVAACVAALGDFPADLIVGLGGGSSIDVAKGCNLVRAGGGTMRDYWGVGLAKGTLLPMIAVPTTAGTGSEMQSFALIGQAGTHQKMACGDKQMAPRIALLDPALTTTQPPAVTACTGLDTVGHAIEALVTRKRNAVSHAFATAAFCLAQEHLPRVLEAPRDVKARGHMLRAAAFGGIAIEHSMLGAAHAMANPLTAHYRLSHGQAVGLMLPAVVRFNAEDPDAALLYAELGRVARLCPMAAADGAAVASVLERIGQLLDTAGRGRRLSDFGVVPAAFAGLAAEAAQQWTAQFNPRPVSEEEFLALFAAAG